MASRIAVMKDGLLQQVDSPLVLYDAPGNLFVAGFIGSPAMNLMDADIVDGGVKVTDYVVPIGRDVLQRASTSKVVIGIRPESFKLSTEDAGIAMEIAAVEETGADSYLYGALKGHAEEALAGAAESEIVARVTTRTPPARGEQVRLRVDPATVHVFDKQTGERIS